MEQEDNKHSRKKEEAGLFTSLVEFALYALALLRRIIKVLLNF